MTDKYEVEVLLRPPVEFSSSIVAAFVAAVSLIAPELLMMTSSVAYLSAGIFSCLAIFRARQGWYVVKYQYNIKRSPRYSIPSKKVPVSNTGLFLGKGFRWTQKHTERLYAARDKNSERYIQDNIIKRFVREKEILWERKAVLKYIVKLTSIDSVFNPLRPPPKTGGDAVMHGVGFEDEKDVYLPLSERPGHTVVIARTRHGKTRLAELLITQDIRRDNNVVIIFDPKGDAALLRRAFIESKRCGRDFIIFHLGCPSLSARNNAVGSFSRITEVASRIASPLPSEGDAKAFKDFAWLYVNVISVALVALGETPDYIKIRRYISDIDPLLVRYGTYWLTHNASAEWKSEIDAIEHGINPNRLSRSEQGKEIKAIAIARYIKEKDIFDPILEGLISAFRFEREYFQKITAAVKPLLEKLTTGKIGEIIAPNLSDLEDERPILDWMEAIRKRACVFVALDAMGDPEVAEVVGESQFADLTSLASRLYKHGIEDGLPKLGVRAPPKIIIHADEFSDLIGDKFKTFINKSAGAGFEMNLYTQTWSDPIAELGDVAKAGQLAGNIGTMIMLGVKETATCEMMTKQLPEVNISEVMSVSSATDSTNFEDGITFVSQNQDRISVSRVPLISPPDIVALSKGQAFALLNGSELWKIRIPLISDNGAYQIPDGLEEMLSYMRSNYTSVIDWDALKEYGSLDLSLLK